MVSPDEPTPVRDVGPYESREQAFVQFQATTFGVPAAHQAPGFGAELVLMEALLLGGVQVSGWEDVQRQEIIRALDAEAVQVVAGWLLRAHLAGRAVESSPAPDSADQGLGQPATPQGTDHHPGD